METPVAGQATTDQGQEDKPQVEKYTLQLEKASVVGSIEPYKEEKGYKYYMIEAGTELTVKADFDVQKGSFNHWYASARDFWQNYSRIAKYQSNLTITMPDKDLKLTANVDDNYDKLYIEIDDGRTEDNVVPVPYHSDWQAQEIIKYLIQNNKIKKDQNLTELIDDRLGGRKIPPNEYVGEKLYAGKDNKLILRPSTENNTYSIVVNDGKAILSPDEYDFAYGVANEIKKWYANEQIYLYAEPKRGKVFEKWTSDHEDVKISYSTSGKECLFDMPEANITLTAQFRDDTVFIGGVRLPKGQYIESGAATYTSIQPDDHYAYLSEDGTELTLHNYDNKGVTFSFDILQKDNSDYEAALIVPQKKTQSTLKIKLEGLNTLSGQYGIAPSYRQSEACNVTFYGSGALKISAKKSASFYNSTINSKYCSIDPNQYLYFGKTEETSSKDDGTEYRFWKRFVAIGLENIPIPSGDTTELIYNGMNQTYNIKDFPAYDISDNTTQKNAGKYTVTVSLKDKELTHWSDGTKTDKEYDFIIQPKQLSGDPEVSTVTESGKTLKNVTLTAPSDWPAGDFSWNDDDETEVTLETSYGWTFTPKDTNNYIGTEGDVIPWKKVLQPGKEAIVADNESGTVKVAEVQLLSSDSEAIKEIAKSSPKAQVQESDDIKLQLKVEDKETAKDVQENAVEKAKEKLEDATFGASFDLTLELFKNGRYVENITDTIGSEISVTVKIPDDLVKDNRSYRVVREHDGQYDVLDTAYNKDNGTLTFATDKFSTYFIVYSDTVKSEEKQPTKKAVKTDTHVHEYQWEYDYADSETDDIIAYNRCKYCGDTKESHTIPNSAYYNWNMGVAKKIAAAKQNAVVTIDTTKWTTFHEMVLHALEKRPDVALRVRYTVVGGKDNGQRRQFTIPAARGPRQSAAADATALTQPAQDEQSGTWLADRFKNGFCGFGNLRDLEETYVYGAK